MGGKASKATISGTPKKGDAAVEDVAIVQNGDAGKDGGNHIIEVRKESRQRLSYLIKIVFSFLWDLFLRYL